MKTACAHSKGHITNTRHPIKPRLINLSAKHNNMSRALQSAMLATTSIITCEMDKGSNRAQQTVQLGAWLLHTRPKNFTYFSQDDWSVTGSVCSDSSKAYPKFGNHHPRWCLRFQAHQKASQSGYGGGSTLLLDYPAIRLHKTKRNLISVGSHA